MGGAVSQSVVRPDHFQILYGGTSPITLTGGMAIGHDGLRAQLRRDGRRWRRFLRVDCRVATVKDTGGATFHYDRRLKNDFMVAGNFMMSSFTWRKY